MSKRNTATKSKHSRGPKIAARAQRVTQAVVRSPKDNRLRSVGAALTESLPERHNEQEALVGDPATAFQQEAPFEHQATALQGDRNNDSTKGFDFSSATANVRAFQAKLLEMAQANMQFAFEFAQRLATIRSPVEFLALFRKHSKEMAELSIRW